MRIRATLLVLGLCLAPAQAEDQPATPVTITRAVETVAAAHDAGDVKALEAFARTGGSLNWVVCERLLIGGKMEAAAALAAVTTGAAFERLPAYVAARRVGPEDRAALARLDEVLAAFGRSDFAAVVGLVPAPAAAPAAIVGVRLLSARAMALKRLRRPAEAEPTMAMIAEATERLGWWAEASMSYNLAGHAAWGRNRAEPALRYWSKRIPIARRLGDRRAEAEAHANLGAVHRGSEHLEAARLATDTSIALYRELGDHAAEGDVVANLGLILGEMGRYAAALEQHARAIGLVREHGTPAQHAVALRSRGFTHRNAGRAREAIADFEGARALFTTLGTAGRRGVAEMHYEIGIALRSVGATAEAIDRLHKALRASRTARDLQRYAKTLAHLGLAYRRLGQFARALRAYDEALAAYGRMQDPDGAAGVETNLANLHALLGDDAAARRHQARAAQAFETAGNEHGVAASLLALAAAQERGGDLADVRSTLERALAIFRRLEDTLGEAGVLGRLGNVALLEKRYAAAEPHYLGSLALFEELGDEHGAASTLLNLALLRTRQGRKQDALATARRASAIAESLGSARLRAEILHIQAEVQFDLQAFAEAVRLAREAAGLSEMVVRGLADEQGARARSTYGSLYELGMLAAFNARDVASLGWFLEQARAGTLRESIGERTALQVAVLPAGLRERLRAAQADRDRVARAARRVGRATRDLGRRREARERLRAAEDALEAVVAVLQREQKAAADLSYPTPASVDELRASLAADEALLLLGSTRRETMALVLTREAARPVHVGRTPGIAELVETLHASDPDAYPTAAVAALREAVARRLDPGPAVRRLLVSTSGPLTYIPFTLLFPDRDVTYVPSGTTWRLLRARADAPGYGVLGLGDPDYRTSADARARKLQRGAGDRLPPLPGTRAEVEQVADTRLLGTDATEARLRAALGRKARWRALHLACHGLVDRSRPQRSSLALTGAAPDDGFLTALEVVRLRVDADLVVLSACDTGRGKLYRGEGLVGLSRAFMYAGAPRVIASLWKVDDEATRALMVKFYELWNPKEGKGLGAAAALRQAQAFVRAHEKWKHPYYWAAWVLWGLPV